MTDGVFVTTNEKEALEQNAIAQFASLFSRQVGRGVLKFHKLLEPPQPDALCTVDAKKIFIEVAHVYGTDADARYLLDRDGKAAPTKRERLASRCIPLNVRLLGSLNNILERKAEKQYDAEPVWLLIRVALPLWTSEDFEEHISEILVPENHPFQEIWLLCDPYERFGLIQLYGESQPFTSV